EELARGSWVPAVDIYSNGQHELVLKAELPDMKQEEIDLTVEDNTLTLRGERKLDAEVAQEQFHRIERSYGSFDAMELLLRDFRVELPLATQREGVVLDRQVDLLLLHVGQLRLQHELVLTVAVNVDRRHPRTAGELF